MIFSPTSLAGSFVIEPKVLADDRGWFARFYCKNEFKEIGHEKEWVQLNHSLTHKKGSVRGMHYQVQPFREIKMVKCIAGAVYDVIVDLRKDSSTFLKWFGAELSAKNRKMLYIPEGFAHGFQCLEENCELIYHHSEFYTPNSEGGIRYDDPAIDIKWPLPVTVISQRDQSHPRLDENFKGI
ncbi:MAG TPA: dTDP-4-dehydrorhamnose 3,5-epimerase [Chitinophagaceae bacterium]|jgi:dTDP-4-dehydrorhamnose 3,5-epimerase|nr:dTDP-4-dehydrorhamnose 3,5-epimerase [Chitinophagaceae bacterium]